MKRLALLSVAIVLATAVNLWAAEERANPYRSGAPAPGATWSVANLQSKSAAQWYIESLDPVVGLTEQQKKAITEVIEARDKAMKEFQSKSTEKLSAAGKAIGEAYQKNDKEAIAKAQKAYQEAYAPIHQAMKDSQKKLDEILTAEQRQKQADHQAVAWIKALTSPIELSEEQKQKAKAAFREMQKNSELGRMERAMPEAIRKILTPEQLVALNKHRLGAYIKAMFARVKLTDEQNKKLEALVEKTCQDPKLTVEWKTYQSVSQKVEELLTEEQKKVLRNPQTVWGQAGGGAIVSGGAPGALLGQAGQYWIGLMVEPLAAEQRKKLDLPDDRGLEVRAVMPESPAAKAGMKIHDVILTVGDRAMKSVQDLVQVVEQAKEKELAVMIIRDGKKQKITVKPAKRIAEGVAVFQIEGKAETAVPGAKVRKLPGGGLEVIISESGEGTERKAATKSLEAARKELEKAMEKARSSAQADMGQRIKRQHELAEKAWQAYQKMQSLGENKKGEAHELWEQIEKLEGQLRQTFEPTGRVLLNPAPGGSTGGGWIQIMPQGQLAPGQSLPGQPLPGAAVNPGERRQDAAIRELRAQVDQLRRDVEQLKAQSKEKRPGGN